MNCPPPGAGPTTRIVWLPVSSMVSKESTIADHTVMRPHVDVMVDRRRQIGAGEQAALLPHLDRHRAGADALENLPRQRIRDHARRRRVQHQRRGTGRRDAVVEPVHAEIRDRRHVDHQAGDHDQRNGEQQQLAGQAEPARRGPFGPAAALEWSAGRRSLTRIFALISPVWRATGPKTGLIAAGLRADLRGCVPPRGRSNYRSLMSAGSDCPGRAACLAPKNPAKTDIFVPIVPFQRSPIAAPRDIDENRGLPYKPRNCPRWPGSPGGGSFGAVNGPFWAGQHHRTYLNSAANCKRQIARSAENYP